MSGRDIRNAARCIGICVVLMEGKSEKSVFELMWIGG